MLKRNPCTGCARLNDMRFQTEVAAYVIYYFAAGASLIGFAIGFSIMDSQESDSQELDSQ